MTKEREILEVDVLFVGAGPASLAGAIRLLQLQGEHNAKAGAGEKSDLLVAVIEKSAGPAPTTSPAPCSIRARWTP